MSVPQAPAAGSRDRIWEWESGPTLQQDRGKGREGGWQESPPPGLNGHGWGLGASNQRPWRLLQLGVGAGQARRRGLCLGELREGRLRVALQLRGEVGAAPRVPAGPSPLATLEPHPRSLGVSFLLPLAAWHG